MHRKINRSLNTSSHELSVCSPYPTQPTATELFQSGKKVNVWALAIAPLTWVRLVTSSALQSRKWQLIGMSQWCRRVLCGHPLPALTDNWTHDAASRRTIAPISHTRPSPLYGHGTVFRSISHLLRHFLSSAVAWRHTSSKSVTRNYCCRAREVTLSAGQASPLHMLLRRHHMTVGGLQFPGLV